MVTYTICNFYPFGGFEVFGESLKKANKSSFELKSKINSPITPFNRPSHPSTDGLKLHPSPGFVRFSPGERVVIQGKVRRARQWHLGQK